MPSQEYYIELDNKTVASFDVSTSTAHGTEFGSTEVKLKSQSILASFVRLVIIYLYVHMATRQCNVIHPTMLTNSNRLPGSGLPGSVTLFIQPCLQIVTGYQAV